MAPNGSGPRLAPALAGMVGAMGDPQPPQRDAFIDFVRAFSLLVVVAWHWVFTIIIWKPDGPHASNPIGFTNGLFIATWLFQVMPLFFFVGGYAHTEAWEAAEEKGRFRSTIGFAWARAGQGRGSHCSGERERPLFRGKSGGNYFRQGSCRLALDVVGPDPFDQMHQ